MSEKLSEKISALMDGEIERSEVSQVVREEILEAEMRKRWDRYHLIRDALKNNLPHLIDSELADRVMSQLEAEPLAPTGSEVVERQIPSWMKQVAGFAIAASVAVSAVIVWDGSGVSGSTPQIDVAQQSPPVAASVKVSSQSAKENIAAPQELNTYLVNHSEWAASNGVGGVSPYVRIVGQDPRPNRMEVNR